MYKRILVPIDGSDASGLALREAIALAKDQNATIRIFHVVDLTTTYSSVSSPHGGAPKRFAGGGAKGSRQWFRTRARDGNSMRFEVHFNF